MGACCGAPTDAQDREVQRDLEKASRADQLEIKLLLLGAGGSGKSTLFKQLEYIHGKGFPPRQRLLFQKQIHEQLIESMKILISRCEEYWEKDPELYAKYKLYDYSLDYDDDANESDAKQNNPTDDEEDAIKSAAENILAVRNNQKLTDEVIADLKRLWANRVIQAMFEIRNEICVPDSSEYFFNELDRVTGTEYVPNDTDLLMVRYRTTGMQEKNFVIKNHRFKICDVGGQRNERRKWIHFFSNVTSVIFVVSLSCYDELTFEDEENAMVVSTQVFDEQVNSEWFADIPFILFLNKSDLFHDKILSVPITVAPCFAEYNGPANDEQASLIHIKTVFNTINKNQARSVFTHVTNATDKDQIEKVFNDVQTMIINWSLERAGLT
eukprot:CAMPEP_0197032722 /NCGR_PEP_ID=MMETSP1384-20130603/11323_1 /TAXON_ID=29189 /ORGANISM="Ammonia sp." /LENGTH=382 /DNA_ID=CAMNT_0042462421 /DNA_START=86 /DNA_END=1234 /DNA_ORIENTATION=-